MQGFPLLLRAQLVIMAEGGGVVPVGR